jgi:L-iditol 2-dehydrogenase
MQETTCAQTTEIIVDKAVVSATNQPRQSQSIPKTMNALVLEKPGCLSYTQREIPQLGEGELLVKVIAATTCGTDLKAFKRGHPQIPMPGVFGHEYSGIVVATGDNAKFQPGQAIMGVHSAPCGTCFWCDRGQENLCETIMQTKVLGSFAEYLVIPQRIANKNVFEKPEQVSFEIASLLEPYSCVAQAISEMQLSLGTPKGLHNDLSVLVIGPGAIGLLFVAALKAIGVENITLAGRNESRLAVGEKFGATTVKVNEFPKPAGYGFDVVIECTGQVEIWEKSIDYVRRGGTLVLFGGCPGGTTATFDTHRLHYDQITLLSPFHFGSSAVKQARQWILEGKTDLSLLLSGDRELSNGEQIFQDLSDGKGIKYVVKP